MFLFLVLLILIIQALKNNRLRNLQWQPDGGWLIRQDKIQQKARLKQGSVVTVFFTSLNFKLENNKNLTVVLFKDNIDPEKFRQLRVRLKVEGIKSDSSVLVDND